MFRNARRPSDEPGSPTHTAVERSAVYPTNQVSYGPSVVPVLPADGEFDSGPTAAAVPSVRTWPSAWSTAEATSGLSARLHVAAGTGTAVGPGDPSGERRSIPVTRTGGHNVPPEAKPAYAAAIVSGEIVATPRVRDGRQVGSLVVAA